MEEGVESCGKERKRKRERARERRAGEYSDYGDARSWIVASPRFSGEMYRAKESSLSPRVRSGGKRNKFSKKSVHESRRGIRDLSSAVVCREEMCSSCSGPTGERSRVQLPCTGIYRRAQVGSLLQRPATVMRDEY